MLLCNFAIRYMHAIEEGLINVTSQFSVRSFLTKCVIVCARRWNYSEFSTCMSPCGIGIQTRDVTCIHEVTHGTGKAVPVPNYMCPQPPPADRRYCNVLDCPVKWSTGEWGKVYVYTCLYRASTISEKALCYKRTAE